MKTQTILDLSYSKARKYFLESQNYCNLQLPVYIDFKPVLDYVQKTVDKKERGIFTTIPPAPPNRTIQNNRIIII